ncbi:hypothetical protein B4113_2382 [Geobacillus sp. B4113_201601]|nr:hypothetical protein B4113_2382 [Geobacillus sp. B4113_201601]
MIKERTGWENTDRCGEQPANVGPLFEQRPIGLKGCPFYKEEKGPENGRGTGREKG